MRIREVIWLKEFSEKIERKHQVYEEEVEEIFRKKPPVRWIGRGDVKGEDLYETIGQTDDGRYLTVFFIYKGKSQGLVISARGANNREMRSYDKRKK